MRNRSAYVAAAWLTAIATLLFAYKWLLIGLPLHADKIANAWQIEADIRFNAAGGPVSTSVFLPQAAPGQQVHDIRLIGTGYGTTTSDDGLNRIVRFTQRQATGEQSIHVRFIVQRYATRQDLAVADKQVHEVLVDTPPAATSPRAPKLTESETAAAQSLVEIAKRRSADDLSLVSVLIKALTAEGAGETGRLLLGDDRSPSKVTRMAVASLLVGGFDARVVHGIDVGKPGRTSEIVSWIEVKLGDRWLVFSPRSGEPKLPSGYVAWWRGLDPLVKVEGGETPKRRISIQRLEQRELDQVLSRGRRVDTPLIAYSLYSLPTSSQELYKILIMVPVGVFLLVILRNIIGIKGLGSFMPVLIALAFRETTLAWGLILFTSITAVGLIARLWLEQMKLLLAPRLAAILMIVILLMGIISVVAHKLGFDRGLSVALFPIVILTMTIERVSILWDERGPAAAIREAIQSLVIATICYLIMSLPGLQHLFFTFPELILLLLAATLVIGRYSGYRLLELPRFRVLAGDKS